MTSVTSANVAMIRHVALRLDELNGRVVFLGGAATALLITDAAAADARPTLDVDVIVEAATTADYHRLGERLRALGFREDGREGAPLCRWRIDGIAVDIMPTDAAALGFGNRWYAAALDQAQHQALDGLMVRVVTAPYFLATKLEAFRNRGNNDFLASHDLEDVVTLIDGRSTVVAEVAQAPEPVRQFLAAAFRELLAQSSFLDALPGHLLADAASQSRLPLLKERMHRIAEMA